MSILGLLALNAPPSIAGGPLEACRAEGLASAADTSTCEAEVPACQDSAASSVIAAVPPGVTPVAWNNPKRAFLTSDHILRASTCLAGGDCDANAWFDQVDAEPCYSRTKAYSLSRDNLVTIPLGDLAVGTFDGLFIESGYTYTLFRSSPPFLSFGKGPKFVSLEHWSEFECAEFEPDTLLVPGSAGALASYTLQIGKTAKAAVTILDPDEQASSLKKRTKSDVLLANQNLRIKIDLPSAVDGVADLATLWLQTRPNEQGEFVTIDLASNLPEVILTRKNKQVLVTISFDDLVDLGLVEEDDDGISEYASIDTAHSRKGSSNRRDSDAFDDLARDTHPESRGSGRGTQPADGEYQGSLSLLNAGGVKNLSVFYGGGSDSIPIQDTADWVYFSGHGHSEDGALSIKSNKPRIGPDRLFEFWRGEVETFFIGGCAVLDINNCNFFLFDDDRSPGRRWGGSGSDLEQHLKNAPKLMLGYTFKGPFDERHGDVDFTAKIIREVLTVTGGDQDQFPLAWMLANGCQAKKYRIGAPFDEPWSAAVLDLRSEDPEEHALWYWELPLNLGTEPEFPKLRRMERRFWNDGHSGCGDSEVILERPGCEVYDPPVG